jgi:hypothetical protein
MSVNPVILSPDVSAQRVGPLIIGVVTAVTKEGGVVDLVRTLLVALVVLLARLIGDQVPASD